MLNRPLKTVGSVIAFGLPTAFAGCGGSGTAQRAAPTDAGADVSESTEAQREAGVDGPNGDAALACGVLPNGGTMADAGDVSYSWTGEKEACFGEPFCQAGCATAFLRGLLDCDAVEGGYFWNFGSVYIRVAGRRGGSCVYDIGSEIEGAVTYQECTAPIPVAPWPGLHNVNGNSQTSIFMGLDGCVSKESCSVQSGIGTQCDEGPAAVPTCPSSPGHC
jgi:hypothetical protein